MSFQLTNLYLPPAKNIFTGFVNDMQISPITFNKTYNINHKANNRWIYDKSGKELYKTTTYFFRDDLDWESLIKYICDKYKNVPKVNFINHACSNGLEPLSFLMGLMIFSPENVKKFTPIIAKDINPENILMAKKGECGASSDDFLRIYKMTGGRYRDFLNMNRDNNTDDKKRLTSIFSALLDITERDKIDVILPLHPRTKKLLPTNLEPKIYERLLSSERIRILPPASFFEIIELERNARLVMTDSGGVQKEAFFFERPCVILRPETEWVEIVEHGAGIIVDANYDKIIAAYIELTEKKVCFPQLFGDGRAAEHILQTILNYLTK